MTPDLIDSCATTSFSTHVPHHFREAALSPRERYSKLLDIVGDRIDPQYLMDVLSDQGLLPAGRDEIIQGALEHAVITLDSEGFVIPCHAPDVLTEILTGKKTHTSDQLKEAAIMTELPPTKWQMLPGDKITPGGRNAHYDYDVKSWPWFFEPMVGGTKKHDMRDKTERDYRIGDRMLLREWDPRTGKYTGREAVAIITYITSNDSPCAMSSNALDRNACILSVDVVELDDTDRNA